MTNDEIKELLRIFNESGVGELELQRGKDRLRIKRSIEHPAAPAAPASFSAAAPPIAASVPAPAAAPAAPPAKPSEPAANQVLVKSPIVGTFYESASPGSAAFVKVGDTVEPGQVLCIIESMKLMNEIEAEVAGTIAAKLVENGRPVEYGEALFAIQPR
ncbi:MAG TPA: acetyl-CoA carboxylase biotin carboxyl carrier protein [Bryobacteraceae bacterium]|nr:acetyl-CoA carboxylase biotin carboxyl carrier protein [Bryobacteraceae bacterium]